MDKLILGFVGEIASGKGTSIEYISKKYPANSYRFSTILRDVLNRLSLEQSRSNMQDLSTFLRERFGQDLLAKVIANDVTKDNGKLVFVDGIRRMADIKYLMELEGFCLINIYADPEVRYKRIIERSENSDDKTKTYEEFLKESQQESELEVMEVSKHADFRIDNNGDFNALYENIDLVIQKKLKGLEIN